MDMLPTRKLSDPDVRHFIYATFADSCRPPTSAEIAAHFSTTIVLAEQSLARLADSHQIALAPGSHTIWMAHPFSAVPTNFTTEIGGNKYWGN